MADYEMTGPEDGGDFNRFCEVVGLIAQSRAATSFASTNQHAYENGLPVSSAQLTACMGSAVVTFILAAQRWPTWAEGVCDSIPDHVRSIFDLNADSLPAQLEVRS